MSADLGCSGLVISDIKITFNSEIDFFVFRMTVLFSLSPTHVFAVLLGFLTSLPGSTTDVSEYRCPKECNCYTHVTGLPADLIVHQCTVSAIGPGQNFSVIDTDLSSGLLLDCSRDGENVLRDYIFSRLKSFVFVTIINCDISITRHTFAGMTKLKDITIKRAKYFQLHTAALVDIPNLENLSILGSGVRSVPNLCHLQNLKSLNLTANHISRFQDVGVNCTGRPILQKLTLIDLTDNEITNVPEFVSKSVPNLRKLSIADNVLGHGRRSYFCDSLRLEWLDINNNSYSQFSADMFVNCSSLNVLGLSYNDVRDIPMGFLSPVPALRLLEFHHNRVGDKIWIELSKLPLLTTLRLDYTNIEDLGDWSLALTNLIKLNLSGNGISNLSPYIFSKLSLKNLVRLDLSKNELLMIDDYVFADLNSLTHLDLRENFIEYISPASFLYLESLEIVNLSYNNLKQLPDMSDIRQLFIVDARNNRIENITESLCEGNSLTGINLMRNEIGHIGSEVFRRCYKLQFLHLSHNKISTIESDSFRDTVIAVLYLQDNQLHDINNLMTNMKHLTAVDLSNNYIGGGIYGDLFPSSIQTLDLSSNFISHIAFQTFIHMDRLRMMDLRLNRIASFSSLDIAISGRLASTPTLRISGNPLKCDCKLYWLKQRRESAHISPIAGMPHISDFITTECSWTYRGDRVMLDKLPIEDFLCEYKERCLSSCICCDYTHCDCRQTCPDPCNCFNSHDWTTNHFVVCGNRGLESTPQALPNLATEIFLDGNNLTSLGTHAIIAMSYLKVVYLNHSNIFALKARAFRDLRALETLHLDHNHITDIQPNVFHGLDHLSVLHIEYNDIPVIRNDTFESLPNLAALYLDNNALLVLSDAVIANLLSLSTLTLSGNPWACDCEFVVASGDLFFQANSAIIDSPRIECEYDAVDKSGDFRKDRYSLHKFYRTCLNVTLKINATMYQVTENENNKTTVYSLTIVCVFAGLVVVVAGLVAWYRDLLRIWIFTKFGVKILSTKLDESGRFYDAFVSYSSKDENFVLHEIIPHLEHGSPKFKLCLHFRDFKVRETISNNIVYSIEESKRTIMLLSNNFLSSEWCRFEFQAAHHQLLKDKSKRLIVVLLGELDEQYVGSDPQLKQYLKTETFLKYDDPWFWQKLKFALPYVRDTTPKPIKRRSYVLPSPTTPYAVVSVVDSVYEEPISLKSLSNDCSPTTPAPKESDNMEVVSINSLDTMNIYEEIYPV